VRQSFKATWPGFTFKPETVIVRDGDSGGRTVSGPSSRPTEQDHSELAGGVASEALREQRVRQARDRLAAGALWQDHDLVFASMVGTPLDDHNVRRQFRVITSAAGLGTTWVPRELRHTFVSLLSAHGVSVEAITPSCTPSAPVLLVARAVSQPRSPGHPVEAAPVVERRGKP
jgi:hypothetical protein